MLALLYRLETAAGSTFRSVVIVLVIFIFLDGTIFLIVLFSQCTFVLAFPTIK